MVQKKFSEAGVTLKLTTHFIDRFNVRSVNQDASSRNYNIAMLGILRYFLENNPSVGLKVGVWLNNEVFIVAKNHANELAVITYWPTPKPASEALRGHADI